MTDSVTTPESWTDSGGEDPSLPQPPERRPRHVAELGYGKALRWSFGGHVALIVLVVVKSLVFPSTPKPYVPTLRVDMVDLPDVLKKDLHALPIVKDKAIEEALKKPVEKPAEKTPEKPVEKAAPDELVLHPKKAAPAVDKSPKREKKLLSALDRIKALEKIEDDSGGAKPVVVKGNKISKGQSLDGDAKESDQASYYDALRGKLQDNWALPVWIARQNFTAQVRVYIDPYGRIRNFRFEKTSGNNQFDSAIKKTLQESQPFPHPPDDIASSLLVDGVLVGFPL